MTTIHTDTVLISCLHPEHDEGNSTKSKKPPATIPICDGFGRLKHRERNAQGVTPRLYCGDSDEIKKEDIKLQPTIPISDITGHTKDAYRSSLNKNKLWGNNVSVWDDFLFGGPPPYSKQDELPHRELLRNLKRHRDKLLMFELPNFQYHNPPPPPKVNSKGSLNLENYDHITGTRPVGTYFRYSETGEIIPAECPEEVPKPESPEPEIPVEPPKMTRPPKKPPKKPSIAEPTPSSPEKKEAPTNVYESPVLVKSPPKPRKLPSPPTVPQNTPVKPPEEPPEVKKSEILPVRPKLAVPKPPPPPPRPFKKDFGQQGRLLHEFEPFEVLVIEDKPHGKHAHEKQHIPRVNASAQTAYVEAPFQMSDNEPEPSFGLKDMYSKRVEKAVVKNQEEVTSLQKDKEDSRAREAEYEIYQDDFRIPKYRFYKKYKEPVRDDLAQEKDNWVPCVTCFDNPKQVQEYKLTEKLTKLKKIQRKREKEEIQHAKALGRGILLNRILSCLCGHEKSFRDEHDEDKVDLQEDDEDLEHFFDAPDFRDGNRRRK